MIAEPVGLADVAPTLAGLAGVALAPPGSALDGRDLSPSLAVGRRAAARRPLRRDRVPAAVRLERAGRAAARRRQVRGGARAATVRSRRRSRRDVERAARRRSRAPGRWPRRSTSLRAARRRAVAAGRRRGSTPSRAPSSRRWAISRAAAPSAATAAGRRRSARPCRRSSARSRKRTGRRSAAVRPRPRACSSRWSRAIRTTRCSALTSRAPIARTASSAASVREYRRAFGSAPGDSQVGYELALALQASGNIEEATTVLAVVLQSDAARPEAHNALGILLLAAGAGRRGATGVRAGARDRPRRRRRAQQPGQLAARSRAARARGRAPTGARSRWRPATPSRSTGWARCWWRRVGRPRRCRSSIARSSSRPIATRSVSTARSRSSSSGDRAARHRAYRDFLAAAESDPHFAEQRAMAIELASRLAEERGRPLGHCDRPEAVSPRREVSSSR